MRNLFCFSWISIAFVALTACSAATDADSKDKDLAISESPLLYTARGAAAHWPTSPSHPGSGKGADIPACYRVTDIPVPPGVPAGSLDSINDTDKFNRMVFAVEAIHDFLNTWGRVADIDIIDASNCSNYSSTNGMLEMDITNYANCPLDPYGNSMACSSPSCPASGSSCACPAPGDSNPCDCRGDGVAGHACFTHTDPKCCGSIDYTPGNRTQVGYQGSGAASRMQLDTTTGRTPVDQVHEMGHALGFDHEFLRNDWAFFPDGTTAPCASDADCSNGDACVGPLGDGQSYCRNTTDSKLTPTADFNSIMAATYLSGSCTQNSAGSIADPTHSLSAWDVMGVQAKYGLKPSGSIVTHGLCANIAGGTTGAHLIMYACKGNGTDQFASVITSSGERLLQATVNGTKECINVAGGKPKTGVLTQLISYGCSPFNSNGNERFSMNGMHLRAMGNMCVAAESTAPGARLVLRRCDDALDNEGLCGPRASSDLDHWDLYGNGLRLTNTNLCVTAPGGTLSPGARPTLTTCVLNSDLQTFDFTSKEIRRGNLCFNVFGGQPKDLSAVGLYNGCGTNQRNESFYVTGPLQTMGQCMTAHENNAGANLFVTDCSLDGNGNPSQEQEFDYYW